MLTAFQCQLDPMQHHRLPARHMHIAQLSKPL